jgi:DnaK suppressor protein
VVGTTDRAAAKSPKARKDKRLFNELELFLRARLAELDSRIREKLEEHMKLRESRSGDPTDIASDAIDDEMALQVAEVETRERIQIREAFEKVAAGTYGFCERCGDRIPVARLKALPSASMCVKCKELEEEYGPAAFEPNGSRDVGDDEDTDMDSESS